VSAGGGWLPPGGPTTRLVLVRHGSTVHSADRRFSGRNELPLNDVGRAQAAALAARAPGFAATAIASSPLPRALQTAQAIGARLDLLVGVVPELIETDFGIWEGLTFAEARAADADALAAWRSAPDTAPPGGESFAAVAERVARGRDALLRDHPGATVVVVSHVTPIKTLLQLALDAPPSAMFRIHLDTASVSIVDYAADGPPSVRLVNDTSHLG
jgi:ribonuclease H / adenosylcobalamin/alpha-ribazole phosphatase